MEYGEDMHPGTAFPIVQENEMSNVCGGSVESKCAACLRGEPVGISYGMAWHLARDENGIAASGPDYRYRCLNFDDECRRFGEPYGYIMFAWKPVKCRNGKWRWLRWVERHNPGCSYTLSNRAH